LREFLPTGTLISHADTLEVMIVENHEITEQSGEDPELKITGRSFETYLENRVVGTNAARTSSTIVEYVLPLARTWTQAVKLINDHIVSPPTNVNDALVNVSANTGLIASDPGTSELREIDRGNVHERLVEILFVDDLGIKTIRRNTFGGVGSSTQTILQVYRGVNKANSVIFSWKSGDLEAADYLFSEKKLKNSALVEGKFVYRMVDLGPTKYDRRVMLVQADDIDGHYDVKPTGAALTNILNSMNVRGQQALKAQNRITISRADVSNTTKYQYRRDYNIGDLVSLDGNFGQIATMRVIEYVEIEDENGESGHPTLSIPGE
jgi:Siphovirus ReqiPepy6 Gp37-like protein